jgi:L-lactate utilization protein LutC
MKNHIEIYWKKRIEKCKEAFERNNFEAYTVDSNEEVKKLILDEIFPKLHFESVSWGDSISMLSTGIIQEVENLPNIKFIKTFEQGVPREEIIERRRQALLVDLFLTGSNAITESGKLVNLDMVGNRVVGIAFGPKNVIIVVGRNKIVKEVGEAMERVKNYAAPLNAIRHTDWKMPCRKTSYCMDCKSPERICNIWTITERSYPKGRIKIIIVNEDLGF